MAAIEAYSKGGFADLMLQGKLEYAQHYGFHAPFWQGREHSDYPQVVAELKTNLQRCGAVLSRAGAEDQECRPTTPRRRTGIASTWPHSPMSPTRPRPTICWPMHCLRAISTWMRPAEYEHTAYGYPRNDRRPRPAYAALVSYQKYEEGLPADARAPVHRRATDAGLKFAQSFPEHPESAGVLTRAAQDLFAAGDQPRAAQAAQLLLARTPPVTRAQQRIAWSIIGQVGLQPGRVTPAPRRPSRMRWQWPAPTIRSAPTSPSAWPRRSTSRATQAQRRRPGGAAR